MPTAEYTIRVAQPADGAPLAALAAEVFTQTYGAVIPPAILQAYLAQRFSPAAMLADVAEHEYLVAEYHGALVGLCKLMPCEERDTLELAMFYVAAEYHGQGVASALMRHVLARTTERGSRRMRLLVWQANPRAIAFYHKWGFVPVGQAEVHVGPVVFDDLVMERDYDYRPGSAE